MFVVIYIQQQYEKNKLSEGFSATIIFHSVFYKMAKLVCWWINNNTPKCLNQFLCRRSFLFKFSVGYKKFVEFYGSLLNVNNRNNSVQFVYTYDFYFFLRCNFSYLNICIQIGINELQKNKYHQQLLNKKEINPDASKL